MFWLTFTCFGPFSHTFELFSYYLNFCTLSQTFSIFGVLSNILAHYLNTCNFGVLSCNFGSLPCNFLCIFSNFLNFCTLSQLLVFFLNFWCTFSCFGTLFHIFSTFWGLSKVLAHFLNISHFLRRSLTLSNNNQL